MQVFVNRSDLTLAANEAVPVLGYYDDAQPIDRAAHGASAAILSLSAGAVVNTSLGMPTLAAGWREANKQRIASAEATRRIDAAFPEYSQRNSLAELTGYLAEHGADAGRWPAAAGRRKAEIDRAWDYVNAVRAAAGGLVKAALPADPTADSHWPRTMTAYQPS